MMTEQAPHSPLPQPILVPVRNRFSRSTSARVAPGSAVTRLFEAIYIKNASDHCATSLIYYFNHHEYPGPVPETREAGRIYKGPLY